MTARMLIRFLRQQSCLELRQKGSHVIVQCDSCKTSIPVHAGEDLRIGLLKAIEKDLEACLGKGWLRKAG